MSSRTTLRLPGYDYSADGAYFLTINTKNNIHFFGDVIRGEMRLSPIGKRATECWLEIPDHFPLIHLDEFVVMPDHLHGILFIESRMPSGGPSVVPSGSVQLNNATGVARPQFGTPEYYASISPQRKTLGVVIRTFKAAVTTWCRRNGFPEFRWQSSYYDRIIRNNNEFERIRYYIQQNPENYFRS